MIRSLNQFRIPLRSAIEIKTGLLRRAWEIGFDDCRIAPAASQSHTEEFRAWLEMGAAGEMDWIARGAEKRCDPEKVLPGVRSVVALAMNYWQGEEKFRRPNAERGISARGRIARYAWGDDYHQLIERKLRELDAFLTAAGGRQKCYVDTGPVLERDFAAEAGIGWHGKSTMLLNRSLGTWFFLAEIFTTLALPSDPPQIARCGSCTRCIDACPTGAITAPHQLDARRCISYLTIELKGSIPLELRSLIGDRIYGCDDCLEACPWNRFAQIAREGAFAPRPALTQTRLRDFLALDDEEFREIFRGSPIKRIKRRGFLRNVCVALGNVGTEEDLPALEVALRDPEPLVVEHARWAIGQIRARLERSASPAPHEPSALRMLSFRAVKAKAEREKFAMVERAR
jgi:epoxyqueuosine reductase